MKYSMDELQSMMAEAEETVAAATDDVEALVGTLTETGNAERFIETFGDKVHMIRALRQWAYWDGIRWREDDTGHIARMYKEIVSQIEVEWGKLYKIISGIEDDKERREELKSLAPIKNWIRTCRSKKTIDSSLALAASEVGVTIPYSDFDSKGRFLGVQNGVVDLRSGKLVAGKPEYKMMKSAALKYEPDAQCPNWLKFVSDIAEGENEKIDMLQQIAGSCMVGNTKDKMFVMQGSGSNGKSTFVAIVNQVLGAVDEGGYAAVINPKVFMEGQSNPEYFIATLRGARSVVMNESAHGMVLNDTLVKQVVDSAEGLQARVVRGEAFSFAIVGTVMLTTNAVPTILATDDGTWRRLCLIEFNRVFTDAEKDRTLVKQKLVPELAGILNWCVAGARRYIENGQQFIIPESIEDATLEWRNGEDKLGGFMREAMVQDGGVIKMTELLTAYAEWCELRGYRAPGERILKKNLEARGLECDKAGLGGTARLLNYSLVSETEMEVFRKKKLIKQRNDQLHITY